MKKLFNINRLFRSLFSLNFLHTNNQDYETLKLNKLILKRYSKEKTKKALKKKPHELLSYEILKIFRNNQLSNFLRNDYIQKIFFIHNRIFLFNYLISLYFDKNWKLWKKLIKENTVGNPLCFFFFKNLSGNKIFQTFHLKNFVNYSRNSIKKYDLILEFGGGYGNMAMNFNIINKKTKYIIYDLYEVNLLQYYYLKKNKISCSFNPNSKSKVILINDKKILKKYLSNRKKNLNKLLIANWSISETPLKLRDSMKTIFNNFNDIFLSYQITFEKIDNKKYFENDFFIKKKDFSKVKTLKIPHLKTSRYFFKN